MITSVHKGMDELGSWCGAGENLYVSSSFFFFFVSHNVVYSTEQQTHSLQMSAAKYSQQCCFNNSR